MEKVGAGEKDTVVVAFGIEMIALTQSTFIIQRPQVGYKRDLRSCLL